MQIPAGARDSSGVGEAPIACSLSGTDMRRRLVAWRELLSSGLVDRHRVPGGIRLAARQGAEVALLELVELERACCPWINIEIAERAQVTLTAESTDGEAVLAHVFLPGAG
jgi:hypothetical protein